MGFFMGMFVGGSVTLLHAGMSGGLKVSADTTHFALTGSSSSVRCLFTLAHCFSARAFLFPSLQGINGMAIKRSARQ